MRPNNSNKRTRSRNRGKNTNPLARSYESNGPDVKIRGSAIQVADKYAQLARDAQSSGDRVMAENYFQHAEHYYRIVAQAYEQNSHNQQQRDRRDDHDRDRRDDGERVNRFEDRTTVRGSGEQPTINGFDGLEEDDEGVRRALKVNGHGNGSTFHGDAANRDGQTGTEDAGDPDDDGAAVVESNASVTLASATPDDDGAATTEVVADAPAGEDAESAEPAAKPKRRARTPRTRTRKRADAESTSADPGNPGTAEPSA
ncbi:MAG: DUF4167 domain-containing protein [Pseudomonadota bacterium]